ncbi:MAG: formylglycine-generating enzyme family protein [Anaerolineae bacterium]|nr:formylglycine-generating enzyme family protein [Anaerolineae bacterium]
MLMEIDWVQIPAGDFIYGPRKDLNIRLISEDYSIARVPITNAQYKIFIDANIDYPVPNDWNAETRQFKFGFDIHPVVHITYEHAESFCEWAQCRLPTEEEWEKAARGEFGNTYPWGEEIDPKLANYKHKNIKRIGTSAVGEYSDGASPYGVLDMAGNVYEWTSSWFNDDRILRVARGGYWGCSSPNVRTTYRKNLHPEFSSPAVGFRPVRAYE